MKIAYNIIGCGCIFAVTVFVVAVYDLLTKFSFVDWFGVFLLVGISAVLSALAWLCLSKGQEV